VVEVANGPVQDVRKQVFRDLLGRSLRGVTVTLAFAQPQSSALAKSAPRMVHALQTALVGDEPLYPGHRPTAY